MSLVSQLFESQPDATPYSAAGIDMSAARYMEELPTSVIDEWPGNREVDGETVALLARDISAEGILRPVLVRPRAYGRYQIIAGHHRVAAVRLLAAQNPGERRWEAVRALAVDLTDAEAERAVVATNVYMTPSWKPPASRRAVEWMRLGEEAMRMRADDPGRWRGTRTDDMIAAIAKERGIEVSASTVKRDKREARLGKAADSGAVGPLAEEVAAGNLTAKQAEALSADDCAAQRSEWLRSRDLMSCPRARRQLGEALLEARGDGRRIEKIRKGRIADAADAARVLAATYGDSPDAKERALREIAEGMGLEAPSLERWKQQ